MRISIRSFRIWAALWVVLVLLPCCGGSGGDESDDFTPAVAISNQSPWSGTLEFSSDDGFLEWFLPADGVANIPHDVWMRRIGYETTFLTWRFFTSEPGNPCGNQRCTIDGGSAQAPVNEADTLVLTVRNN